jgi:2-polyprenyl-6-methoxyphenol hydroxylase-like FAD-dependent oxidoreductase
VNGRREGDPEVVIIGAGPVGTALGIDLALAGVRTLVLEQRAETDRPHPGTNLTNIRTMELFRRWGATEHVRASNPLGPRWARDVQFPTRGNGYMVAKIPGVLGASDPFPFSSGTPHFGPQMSVERGLRARLAELPAAEIRYSSTFGGFEQDDDAVTVQYRDDSGAERTITAQYLVGADGSSSQVRKQLGIRLEGTPGLAEGAAWFVRSPAIRDLMAEHLGQAAFVWFANEDRTGAILIGQSDDGVFQYTDIPLPPGVDGNDWDAMRARLIRTVGEDVAVEPIEGGHFRINSLVAPRFSDGRVFIAGEAAHHISVFGGFGMNTGMGDAGDLGWKLTAAIHGWAGPGLLRSYDAERIPVVRWIRDLTEESTTHLAPTWTEPGMEQPGPHGDAIRARVGQRILEEKQHELLSLGAQLGAAYYDSPVVVSDGTRPPAATFGEFTPSASPGARAPHVWLGPDRSLYDEIAHEGFTLLVLDPAADAGGLVAAAAERTVPLKVVTPGQDGLAELYGARLALLRPDHYVAWRGADAPEDAMAVIDATRGAVAAVATPAGGN